MGIGAFTFVLMFFVGLALLLIASATIFKIYKGSKITFCYILTAFTCGYAAQFIIRSILIILFWGP